MAYTFLVHQPLCSRTLSLDSLSLLYTSLPLHHCVARELTVHPDTAHTFAPLLAPTVAGWLRYTDKVSLSLAISAVVCKRATVYVRTFVLFVWVPRFFTRGRPLALPFVHRAPLRKFASGLSRSCATSRTASAREPSDFLNHPTHPTSSWHTPAPGGSPCRLSSGSRALATGRFGIPQSSCVPLKPAQPRGSSRFSPVVLAGSAPWF